MSVSLIDGHIDREKQTMTDNEIIKALNRWTNNFEGKVTELAILCNALDLIKRKDEQIEGLIAGQETLQKALNEKIEESENQSQNFKVLVSDHRTLQQSFDNLKGLYESEKSKVEKAKEKSIHFAKELQTAKAEIERLTEERDRTIKDFTEFARIAHDIPFACKYCAHSIEDGRACLWKAEHEDEEEACLGRHFEYKEMVGDAE